MKFGDRGPTATPESKLPDVPLQPPLPWTCPADVRLCGHLRKQKSLRRRFFVLRADPPRLECYKNEKKFRASCGPARPPRNVSLEGACTISKRADARQRHLIVLYTRDSSLGVATASEAEQQAWYNTLLEVHPAALPCGHADSFFFLELGRSAPTGPRELWLQTFDAVVAQSIHEMVLAAVKRLGSDAAGGRAESLPRDPPTNTSRPSVHQLYESPATAAQSSGLSRLQCLLGRRIEQITETLMRLGTAASYPKELDWSGELVGEYVCIGYGTNGYARMDICQAQQLPQLCGPGLDTSSEGFIW